MNVLTISLNEAKNTFRVALPSGVGVDLPLPHPPNQEMLAKGGLTKDTLVVETLRHLLKAQRSDTKPTVGSPSAPIQYILDQWARERKVGERGTAPKRVLRRRISEHTNGCAVVRVKEGRTGQQAREIKELEDLLGL